MIIDIILFAIIIYQGLEIRKLKSGKEKKPWNGDSSKWSAENKEEYIDPKSNEALINKVLDRE